MNMTNLANLVVGRIFPQDISTIVIPEDMDDAPIDPMDLIVPDDQQPAYFYRLAQARLVLARHHRETGNLAAYADDMKAARFWHNSGRIVAI